MAEHLDWDPTERSWVMTQLPVFLLIILTVWFLSRQLKKTPLARLGPTQQSMIAGAVLIFLLLALTGRLGLLIPLVGAVTAAVVALANRLSPWLGPILLREFPAWLARWREGSAQDPGANSQSAQNFEVRTPFLRMALNRATGQMQGIILQGPYEGRQLDELPLHALLDVYSLCLKEDEESARLLAAFIEQRHHDPKTRANGPSQPADSLDRDRALAILGLDAKATPEEILARHRQLIQKIHPDRGGSDFLAAQINQAKDVLLRG